VILKLLILAIVLRAWFRVVWLADHLRRRGGALLP
jgi:hypothetical protein